MMSRILSIVLFLAMFALMTIPAETYACGKNQKKTEQGDHHKKSESKPEKKNACKEDPCKGQHSGKDQGCGSNCNHSNCKCVHFTVTLLLTQENLLKDSSPDFSVRKQKALNTGNNLSEGFHNIWQPPKIS